MLDRDFFSIIDFCGEKSVHIHGYFYESDGEEKPFRVVDFTGLIIPIAEFVAEFKERGYDYIDEIISGCKQYIDDIDEDRMREVFANYYSIQCFSIPRRECVPFSSLFYKDITEETEYGDYFNGELA